jgi:hypothetical protein
VCRVARITALALLAHAAGSPALAQQGSLRISGAAQALTGSAERIGGQERLEPDLAIGWLQPGSRFGTFQIEIRGTTRDSKPQLGRSFASWRDLKVAKTTWAFDAGDLYFSPGNEDYRFTNLVANPVTLLGGIVSMRTPRSSALLVGGRTTAWRNIFGTDSDVLDQTLGFARVAHAPAAWLRLNAHASRVRTRDLDEFAFSVASSDQVGVGVHVMPATTLHVVADAAYSAYTRVGSPEIVRDGSGTIGVSYLHARGWVQANAFRFSPGNLPVINYSLNDREGLFVASEYDLFRRVRVYGGWESLATNLDPGRAAGTPLQVPQSSGDRLFGGFRVVVLPQVSLSLRAEDGGRRTRRTVTGLPIDSDAGAISSELFGQFGRVSGLLRYSYRDNVETGAEGNYEQSDAAVQMFVNLTRDIQIFGSAGATRNLRTAGSGSTSWQVGGGGSLHLFRRSLLLRLEGTSVRNEDLLTDHLGVRDSLNIGVNGNIARHTTLGFTLFADHSPTFGAGTDPWMTRSTLQLVRTFPTGSMRVPGSLTGSAAEARARGTGRVVGTVFADWNGDGVPGANEEPLEGISIILARGGATTSSALGEFSFTNVATGAQLVQIDIAALPVDFDPPASPGVELDISRNGTRRVAFGLVPLGSVGGRVLRDANGNAVIDPADEPLDGAVLVLDGGLRSEQVRKGAFRFDAVRSGPHALELLTESLPDGSTILTPSRVAVSIERLRTAPAVDFLVKVDQRPEIRRVFPPKRGGGAPSPAPSVSSAASRGGAPPRQNSASVRNSRTVPPSPASRSQRAGSFTIQVAALSQAARAETLADELRAAGHDAYVLEPPADDPHGLYRVRVGRFASRQAATAALPTLEQLQGEKLWIIKGQ